MNLLPVGAIGSFWKKTLSTIIRDMRIFQSNEDYLSIFWLQKKNAKKKVFWRVFYKKQQKKKLIHWKVNSVVFCFPQKVKRLDYINFFSKNFSSQNVYSNEKKRKLHGPNYSLCHRRTVRVPVVSFSFALFFLKYKRSG